MCCVKRGKIAGDGKHSDPVPRKYETRAVLLNPAAEKCSQVFHSTDITHNSSYCLGGTVHLQITMQV